MSRKLPKAGKKEKMIKGNKKEKKVGRKQKKCFCLVSDSYSLGSIQNPTILP